AGSDTDRGTSRRPGTAGSGRARDRAGQGVGEEHAFRDWVPERDESSAGELAAGGNPHRTAEHYRLSEVEEPHGRVQPGQVAGRAGWPGRGSQRIPAGNRGRLRSRSFGRLPTHSGIPTKK